MYHQFTFFTVDSYFNCQHRATSISPTHRAAYHGKPWVIFSSTCARTWRSRWFYSWLIVAGRIKHIFCKCPCWKSLASVFGESSLLHRPPFHSLLSVVVVVADVNCEFLCRVCWVYLYWTGKEASFGHLVYVTLSSHCLMLSKSFSAFQHATCTCFPLKMPQQRSRSTSRLSVVLVAGCAEAMHLMGDQAHSTTDLFVEKGVMCLMMQGSDGNMSTWPSSATSICRTCISSIFAPAVWQTVTFSHSEKLLNHWGTMYQPTVLKA
jgi:hypothetical protein